MSRLQCCVALVTALLAAGCAVAPNEATENGRSAETAPGAGVEATASAAADEVQGADDAPTLVVDAKQLATVGSGVVCRDMLKQGSNVIVRQCMTPATWKAYEQRQMADAQEVLRMLQGSAYR